MWILPFSSLSLNPAVAPEFAAAAEEV